MLLRLAVLCLTARLVLCEPVFTSERIARWNRPRAALIRNNIYLAGGQIDLSDYADGKFGQNEPYVNSSLLRLSLNESFDISGGNPAGFESILEDNLDVTWLDGFMFADWDELYTYGFVIVRAATICWLTR